MPRKIAARQMTNSPVESRESALPVNGQPQQISICDLPVAQNSIRQRSRRFQKTHIQIPENMPMQVRQII